MAAILQTTCSNVFCWMKILEFKKNICSLGSNWQYIYIGSDNGLAPSMWQAIIWTNADPVHRRIYAALGGDELTAMESILHYYGWFKCNMDVHIMSCLLISSYMDLIHLTVSTPTQDVYSPTHIWRCSVPNFGLWCFLNNVWETLQVVLAIAINLILNMSISIKMCLQILLMYLCMAIVHFQAPAI